MTPRRGVALADEALAGLGVLVLRPTSEETASSRSAAMFGRGLPE